MSSFADIHDALADAIETQLATYSITVTDSYPRWGDPDVALPTASLVIISAMQSRKRVSSTGPRTIDLQFALILFGETEHEAEGMTEVIMRWLPDASITVDSTNYVVKLGDCARHENRNDIEAEDHAFDVILQINGV